MSEEADSIQIPHENSYPDEEQNQSQSVLEDENSPNEDMKTAEIELIEQGSTMCPKFSLEGYPELPIVMFDENLEEQLDKYGKLGDAMDERILREIEEGHKKLKDLGMTEETFRAQCKEDFHLYDYATEHYPCIVPGTRTTALYIEFIRLFILLLARELKYRIIGAKKDRNFSSASTVELIERTSLACEKVSLSASSSPQAKIADSTPSRSGDEKSEVMETARSTFNSILSSGHKHSPIVTSNFTFDICTDTDGFISKLTVLKNMLDSDPVTKAFSTRLEKLIEKLKSLYYSIEETAEDSSTSADVSDLPLDPVPAPTSIPNIPDGSGMPEDKSDVLSDKKSEDAESSSRSVKVHTLPSQKSTDSSCDVENLPEDCQNA